MTEKAGDGGREGEAMSDLIERLRKAAMEGTDPSPFDVICHEAADELERLRAKPPQMPIMRVLVDNGVAVHGTFYAPGLPDGEHDLFCAPCSPDGQWAPSMFAPPRITAEQVAEIKQLIIDYRAICVEMAVWTKPLHQVNTKERDEAWEELCAALDALKETP